VSATPWFRFFPSDWLAGTSELSAAEKGVYITLLALIYDHGGSIERDDGRLGRRCGLPKVSFTKVLESLIDLKKISEVDGRLENDRAKNELSERENRIHHARAGAEVTNSKKQAKSKSEIRSGDIDSERSNVATEAAISQPQSHTSSLRSDDGAKPPKSKSTAADIKKILEAVLSPDLVAGVIEHRRKKGAPLTEIAAAGLARDFAATGLPDDAARMMIERGWQGFKLDWWNNDRASKQPRAGPSAANGTSQAFADLGAQLRNRRNEQPQGSIFSDEEARGAIIDAEPIAARS